MVLGFKQIIKGKQTHFIAKIKASVSVQSKNKFVPKIHTIRECTGRWKAGMVMHMATGVRTVHYHQFNKGIEKLQKVVSTQTIHIYRVDDTPLLYDEYLFKSSVTINDVEDSKCFRVKIDDRFLTPDEIITLSINDGFDFVGDFFDWFNNDDFIGTIIHWTPFKY